MTATGKKKKAAFYCRRLYLPRHYSHYLKDVGELIKDISSGEIWETEVFQEPASGNDELMRLEAGIEAGMVDAVITLEATTIAGDWRIFWGFMALREEHSVPVYSLEWWKHDEDAEERYQIIKQLRKYC